MSSHGFKGAILYILLLISIALPSMLTASSHTPASIPHKTFHFYWQDKFNFTDLLVLPGLPDVGSARLTTVSLPYGSMFVFVDPLTETPNPASMQIGIARGTSVGASFDGMTAYSAFTFELNKTSHQGTLSFLGSYPTTVIATVPIVGGTGDFLFAQGYGVFNLVNTSSFNVTSSVDLHIYWPLSAI